MMTNVQESAGLVMCYHFVKTSAGLVRVAERGETTNCVKLCRPPGQVRPPLEFCPPPQTDPTPGARWQKALLSRAKAHLLIMSKPLFQPFEAHVAYLGG